jgi:hypothetical protein
VEEQRRNVNRRKHGADVDIEVHAAQVQERARRGRQPRYPRLFAELVEVERPSSGRNDRQAVAPALVGFAVGKQPLLEQVGGLPLVFVMRWCPREVRRPDVSRLRSKQGKRKRALRIGRCEEQTHCASVGHAEERRARRLRRFHHGPYVVHPLLQRRRAVDRIRRARAALVEDDHARERAHPLEAGMHTPVVAVSVETEEQRRNDDEIERAVTPDAVGDVHVAALRVAGLRNVHARKDRTSAVCVQAALEATDAP